MAKITGNHRTRQVFIDGVELTPERSLKIRNHSPDGFAWGFNGSGPAQLALALLLEYFPPEEATRWYREFKWAILAHIPMESDFDFEDKVIIEWVLLREGL